MIEEAIEQLFDVSALGEQLAAQSEILTEVSGKIAEVSEKIAEIAAMQELFQNQLFPLIAVFLGIVAGAVIGLAFINQWKLGV